MSNNPAQDILNLINNLSQLENSVQSLKNVPVIGEKINALLEPISNIKTQITGIANMANIIPDLPGDWDNQIKNALSSFSNTNQSGTNSNTENNTNDSAQNDNPLDIIGSVLGGSDVMKQASDLLGGFMKK